MSQQRSTQELASVLTGRPESLFAEAMAEVDNSISESVAGRNILLTGGAGFIGAQTLRVLLAYQPRSVTVVDTSENGLAELVRDLRSDGLLDTTIRIEPRLVDITSPLVDRIWDDLDSIDFAYQFAAAKHVRSERDPVSLLRMLQVNLNGTVNFTRSLIEANPDCGVFVVSTDKAADPSSLMGASKRLMEMAILGTYANATSTRFANVAFSSGSLLESWLLRLRSGQPLAVPRDTWRYFVTPREAGQICAISSVASPGSVVIPDEDLTGMVELETALIRVLGEFGRTPVFLSESEALTAQVGPAETVVVRSERDTAGEKREEKFLANGEQRQDWLSNVRTIITDNDPSAALQVAAWIDHAVQNPAPRRTVDDISRTVAEYLPEFSHIRSDRRLDDRL